MTRAVVGGLERRRWDVERTRSMSVRLHRVSGKVLVQGTGEVAVDVAFPVTFIEEPVLNFGGALHESYATAGSYPTVSVVVTSWLKREKDAGTNIGFYYEGATLAIVVTGSSNQSMWVHWSAEGKAFRNPVKGDVEAVNETI